MDPSTENNDIKSNIKNCGYLCSRMSSALLLKNQAESELSLCCNFNTYINVVISQKLAIDLCLFTG